MSSNQSNQDHLESEHEDSHATTGVPASEHMVADSIAEDEAVRLVAAMSRRQRRKMMKQDRKQRRREKWLHRRDMWLENAIDQPLPEAIQDHLPRWIDTRGGRWAVIGLGALVLVLWLVFLLWFIT